jgi:chemotaxis protein CheD
VVIDVPTASHAVGRAPDNIGTSGVGSCVVICLYSQEDKSGGLVHYMLPRAEQDMTNVYRYADTSLSAVLSELAKAGIRKDKLTAKVIGGAQMFPGLAPLNEDGKSIGQRNVEEADLLLKTIGIPIVGKSILGFRGKSLVFDLASGNVVIDDGKQETSQTI